MASRKDHIVTAGGKERIDAVVRLYSIAFRDDPVFTYMLPTFSDEERHAYLNTYFTKLMTAAGMNQAVFEEANDFSAATVVMPPGKKIDNPLTLIPAGLAAFLFQIGLQGCQRMLFEFGNKTTAAKKKGLGRQKKYWYLFFIATHPEREGQGLGTVTLKAVQSRAAAEGLPVWLESTTEKSLRLYTRNGFELVEKIMLGEGHSGADGRYQKAGPGTPLWAMVWWPPTKS